MKYLVGLLGIVICTASSIDAMENKKEENFVQINTLKNLKKIAYVVAGCTEGTHKSHNQKSLGTQLGFNKEDVANKIDKSMHLYKVDCTDNPLLRFPHKETLYIDLCCNGMNTKNYGKVDGNGHSPDFKGDAFDSNLGTTLFETGLKKNKIKTFFLEYPGDYSPYGKRNWKTFFQNVHELLCNDGTLYIEERNDKKIENYQFIETYFKIIGPENGFEFKGSQQFLDIEEYTRLSENVDSKKIKEMYKNTGEQGILRYYDTILLTFKKTVKK